MSSGRRGTKKKPTVNIPLLKVLHPLHEKPADPLQQARLGQEHSPAEIGHGQVLKGAHNYRHRPHLRGVPDLRRGIGFPRVSRVSAGHKKQEITIILAVLLEDPGRQPQGEAFD